MAEQQTELKRTPLFTLHAALGAKMVPFAGYAMPVQYPAGILKEHEHTRRQAGLFDVSHMGQVRLIGAGAAAAVERLVPVDVCGLAAGRQRYALFTNDAGGILDDLMITNAGDHLFLVVNAACKEQDLAHLQRHVGDACAVTPLTGRALLALQGPAAAQVLGRIAPAVARLRFMTGARLDIGGADCFVTRSGYT
ncbi:MAG TPA: glycine cleavage system aminomethyltransferase GcvT, partial [Kiloniellales bacterium]